MNRVTRDQIEDMVVTLEESLIEADGRNGNLMRKNRQLTKSLQKLKKNFLS